MEAKAAQVEARVSQAAEAAQTPQAAEAAQTPQAAEEDALVVDALVVAA